MEPTTKSPLLSPIPLRFRRHPVEVAADCFLLIGLFGGMVVGGVYAIMKNRHPAGVAQQLHRSETILASVLIACFASIVLAIVVRAIGRPLGVRQARAAGFRLCPTCRAPLAPSGDAGRCGGCGRSYAIAPLEARWRNMYGKS